MAETPPTKGTAGQVRPWSAPIRWLHLGLAGSVTIQLWLSLVMGSPGDAQGITAIALIFHELFGLLVLTFAVLLWLWLTRGHDGGWLRLFPIVNKKGRSAVGADLKGILQGRLPQGGARSGLPGLIQGLGLVIVTFQGLTGFGLFVVLPPEGDLPARFEFLAQIHSALGPWLWLYWLSHGGLALLHGLRKDSVLKAMSPFGR